MKTTSSDVAMVDSQSEQQQQQPPFVVATKEILLSGSKEDPAAPAQVIDPIKTPLWEIDGRFLNPDAKVPDVQTYVTMSGRKALPLQGIISFSAKPKQGKSSAIRALLRPILTGLMFDSVIPTVKPRLCVTFDTEMDVATLQERTKSMRKDLGEDANRYQVVSLLEIPKPQRIDVIEEITQRYNPDIVVIDQVAMLVSDYNNSEECNDIRDRLLTFAAKRAIWCVIHQNKAADNKQMKGHLGSMLDEAAVENYSVERNDGVFEVKPVNARRTYVDEQTKGFTFAMDEQGNVISSTEIILRNKEEQRKQIAHDLTPIFGSDKELSRTEIVNRIMKAENIKDSAAEIRVTDATTYKAIIKVDPTKHRSPYRLNL